MKLNRIWLDIKELPKWHYILLIAICSFFIINTSLNYKNHWMLLSIIASLTSVLNVWLIATRKVSNFFWGIQSCIFYGVYAWQQGYVGDGILNIAFYLPLTIIGFLTWRNNMKLGKILIVKKRVWRWKYLIAILPATVVVFVSWYYLIPEIGHLSGGYLFKRNSWQHILDAFTNTMGVISTFLLQYRLWAQNVCYFISNPMNITMWIILKDLNLIITYSLYLLVTFVNAFYWFDKNQKKESSYVNKK